MHICDVIKNKQLQRITRHSLLSQWKVLIKMTLSFQPQLLSKYESSSNTCLEFILITCRVRRWLNLLGEITQRCYKIIQMSHQTRQWQLHTTLTECSVPDLTLWRLGKSWHIFFFFKLPAHSACVSLMSWWMKQRQARRWQSRGAGLRCEQVCGFTAVLEWEQFQVHSCGVWLAYTPSRSACVEILSPWEGGGGGLGRRERWAGWGSSVNLISRCFNFEQWGRKRVRQSEC